MMPILRYLAGKPNIKRQFYLALPIITMFIISTIAGISQTFLEPTTFGGLSGTVELGFPFKFYKSTTYILTDMQDKSVDYLNALADIVFFNLIFGIIYHFKGKKIPE